MQLRITAGPSTFFHLLRCAVQGAQVAGGLLEPAEVISTRAGVQIICTIGTGSRAFQARQGF